MLIFDRNLSLPEDLCLANGKPFSETRHHDGMLCLWQQTPARDEGRLMTNRRVVKCFIDFVTVFVD